MVVAGLLTISTPYGKAFLLIWCVPAAVAWTWSAEVRGHELVTRALGVVVARYDLRGASAAFTALPATNLLETEVLVLLRARVVQSRSPWPRRSRPIEIGYTRFIGSRSRTIWLTEITAAASR